jgi:hypothetical protein
MFHMDIVELDRDITYVAMAIHICYKRLFQCLICFFISMLQGCLFGCCICCNDYTCILQVSVPMFNMFFRSMLQGCLFGCCISSAHMLQVFLFECCI